MRLWDTIPGMNVSTYGPLLWVQLYSAAFSFCMPLVLVLSQSLLHVMLIFLHPSQHCSLADSMLEGLSSLKQLEKLVLSDNLLSCSCLSHLTSLTALQHLDLSVMPSISRMRSSSKADLHALGKLTALQELNIIGFGVRDAVVVSQLTRLTHLEAGLNPLSARKPAGGGGVRTPGWGRPGDVCHVGRSRRLSDTVGDAELDGWNM